MITLFKWLQSVPQWVVHSLWNNTLSHLILYLINIQVLGVVLTISVVMSFSRHWPILGDGVLGKLKQAN